MCETTREMQEKFEVTYEGTTKVKELKIRALANEYELFKMNNDEGVESIFFWYNKIVSELKYLGMIYSNIYNLKTYNKPTQSLGDKNFYPKRYRSTQNDLRLTKK